MAGLGVVLLGTGVTAFGIAPMAPDVSALPRVNVVEGVQPTALTPTSAIEAEIPQMVLFRTEMVRRDDTVDSLLARLGVRDTEAEAFLRKDDAARQLFTGGRGRNVTVETTGDQSMLRLTARWLHNDEREFSRLVVERQSSGFASEIQKGELTTSSQLASGEIRSSLFASTDAANIPDSVAIQMAEIFSNDIDFRRDLRRGDNFSVVYEVLEADGEAMRPGRVLSAQFVNKGRAFDAVWFEAEGQKGGYFDFDGQSTRKSFLTSPLAFTRVSSGFGMRFHPISKRRKAHLGVDYAAPRGTAVRTIGDGVVKFAGWQRGYGKIIEVAHRNGKSTKYAHLSRIDVRKGQRVAQGDNIGAVGSTGASTGPHLHLEFLDKGEHRDPLKIARESESIPVPASLRSQFGAIAKEQKLALSAASTVIQASAR
ncbi:peptidoglycan DD-metalloendopeptidase family protein [Hydrogenophaga sp. 5NK40-0174]